ncbi:MAG: PAS domain-containing protein [Pseudomonadota bacterium]
MRVISRSATLESSDKHSAHWKADAMPVVSFGLPYNDGLQTAVKWYLNARQDKIAPGWSDIDPESLGPLINLAWVVRVEPVFPIFTYRFAGTTLVEALGRDPTGMALSEIVPPQIHEITHGRYMSAVREQAAYFAIGRVRMPIGQQICERAVFPLMGRSGVVDHLLGFTLYQDPPISGDADADPVPVDDPVRFEDETIASYVPLKSLHYFAR